MDKKTGAAIQVVKEFKWEIPAELIQEYGRHAWCFYCRRPTVFAYFERHHNFIGTPLENFYDRSIRRCTLCGISESHGRTY